MRTMLSPLFFAAAGSIPLTILIKVTATTMLALAVTQLAGRRSASTRHAVLTAAFAILLLLPPASLLAPPVAIPLAIYGEPPAVQSVTSITTARMDRSSAVSQFRSASTADTPPTMQYSPEQWIFAVWLLGAVFFLMPVGAGLWQTRRLRQMALPWHGRQALLDDWARDAGIRRHVDLLLHESLPGPITSGTLRPAIILPLDARNWTAKDLERALVHELEHVRRADWLTRATARVLCAIYWFHPLVWMAWRRFVLDAERACDDAVIRRAEPADYADQLVGLAQRMLSEAHPPRLAMASRYELAARVSAVLDRSRRRGRPGFRFLLATATTCAVAVAALSPLHLSARIWTPSQTATDNPNLRFEAATVKPCKEVPDYGTQRRPEFTYSPGRIRIECIPLARIAYFAYAGVGSMDHPLLNDSPSNPDHVRGGPGWMATEMFTIEATAEGTTARAVMMGPMLRALLEDRFHLKSHRETEEVPLYSLTVAKGGLKIHPIAEDGCTSFEAVKDLSGPQMLALDRGDKPVCGNFTALGDDVNRTWSLGGTTLTRFANSILSGILDRFVVDRTGVDGRFNIKLAFWLYDENVRAGAFGGRPVAPPPDGVERGISIFTALEEQLGLKLEPIKGPREFLVIDSVERPTGD